MTHTKGLIVCLAIVFAGLSAYFLFTPDSRDVSSPSRPAAAAAGLIEKAAPSSADRSPVSGGAAPPEAITSLDYPELIDSLTDQYGAHIDHPRVQMEALDHLIHMLKKTYPDTWRDHLNAYLTAAFPDHADILIKRLEQLLAYGTWGDENRDLLADLSPRELTERLWEKRLEVFGDDALAIWEMELKKNEVDRLAGDIDAMAGAPFDEKLNRFRRTLDDIYGDTTPAYIKHHAQELLNTFLAIGSVQDDLHIMDADTRKDRLTDLRKTMGMDDEALTRWSDLDDARDHRWSEGLAYMAARDALIAAPDTEDRDHQLSELRRKHFGTEADIIAAEEASGMFRFTRKRLYGKN
ncbi:hypothetical protein JCM14469_37010 [Desulfatiferula olefinivorans]